MATYKSRSCKLLSWPVCLVKELPRILVLFVGRGFVTLKRIFKFVWRISCSLVSCLISNIEGNARKMLFCHPFFGTWLWSFWGNWLLGERFGTFVHHFLFPFFFFFLTHYSPYCFLCIYECNTPVIITMYGIIPVLSWPKTLTRTPWQAVPASAAVPQ